MNQGPENKRRCKRQWLLRTAASALACGTISLSAQAAAQSATVRIDIPAQPLAQALMQLSRQTNVNVVAPASLTRGRSAPAVRGSMSVSQALDRLLTNSGLTYRTNDGGSVIIEPRQAEQTSAGASPSAGGSLGAGEAQAGGAAADSESADIIVTGTTIRGVHPRSSALITIDQDEISRSGVGSVDQLMRQVPQNFAALDQETYLGNGGDVQVAANSTRGATVDLRGLGIGATLVLVNGHRIAPSGDFGAFVDISMIPLTAIERVEILTDGASAIYGADAVAGVVNFVLRRDFSGAETTLRYGAAEGLEEYKASQLAGHRWRTGSAMAVYEYYNQGELLISERDYLPDPGGVFALIPRQERHSVFATARQELTAGLEFSVDGFYGTRDFEQDYTAPFLVSESGNAESYGFSGALSVEATPSWRITASGNYATTRGIRNVSFPDFDFEFSDRTRATTLEGDLRADGPVVDLPGGGLRASVGISAREDRFGDDSGGFSRSVNAAFGELFIPIFSSLNEAPFARRLELSIAGRYDDYSDVGSSFNPRFGLLWEPLEGVSLRGTYATSFRAPPLSQLRTDSNLFFVLPLPNPASPTGESVTLIDASIGTPDLAPEEAESYTFGVDVNPPGLPGFRASATYYNVEFTGRINFPPFTSLFTIFEERPFLEPFFDFTPDPAEVARIFAEERLLNFAGVGPEGVEVFFDSRLKNLARTEASGIDLSVNYDWSSGGNEWGLFGSGAILLTRSSQAAPTTPEVDLIGKIYNPPRFRGRAGGTWSSGPWGANLAVNYTGPYDNNLLTPPERVGSWVTVDAQISWSAPEEGTTFLRGFRGSVSVLNLTGERPPLISGGNNINIGFDPTNASARGRFIAVQLTKRW